MEMNSANVEAVVKQVLESMLDKKNPGIRVTAGGKPGNSEDSTCCYADFT